eukprot:6368253-Amphidinium_carterae.1
MARKPPQKHCRSHLSVMTTMPNIVREANWIPFNGPSNPPPLRVDDTREAARYFGSSFVSSIVADYNRADSKLGSPGLEDDIYMHDDEEPKLWSKPCSELDALCFSLTEE